MPLINAEAFPFGSAVAVEGNVEAADELQVRRAGIHVFLVDSAEAWTEDARRLYQSAGITGLRVCPAAPIMIAPLSEFDSLQGLNLGGNWLGPLDLAATSQLTCLMVSMPKGAQAKGRGIQNLERQRSLRLLQGDIPANQVHAVGQMTRLKYLHFFRYNQRDLSALPTGSELEHLHVARGGALEDLSDLARVPNLQTLVLDGCRRVSDYSVLAELRSLRWLALTEGEVPSLDFLERLDQLEGLVLGGTRVQSRDYRPVLTLQNLRYGVIPLWRGVNVGAHTIPMDMKFGERYLQASMQRALG